MDEKSPNLKIVDASSFMPKIDRNPWQEHLDKRITDETVFFDLDHVCDQTSPLPHTMPSVEIFTKCMKELNIQKIHNIVCYDSLGLYSASRYAWTMRFYGATDVRILNGGLKKWQAEGRSIVSGDQAKVLEHEEGDYTYSIPDSSVCLVDIKEMHKLAKLLRNGDHTDFQVLDARSAARFKSEAPEPRAGVKSGNI